MFANRTRIVDFWDWFSHQAPRIGRLVDNHATVAVAELFAGKRASLATRLGWEVGPGLARPYAFSLALRGELRHLNRNKALVSLAPPIAEWELHPARPPKEWNLEFGLHDNVGGSRTIVAREWRYVLVGYDNMSFFDVTVLAPNLAPLATSAQERAARTALIGQLGEIDYLRLIDRVSIATDDAQALPNASWSDLKFLREHIGSMTALTDLAALART